MTVENDKQATCDLSKDDKNMQSYDGKNMSEKCIISYNIRPKPIKSITTDIMQWMQTKF